MSPSAAFCTPIGTTTACLCHLSQSALPPGHRLPGPYCSQEFPPPTQSQASLPTPGRACAGWGVQSQHKARTLHQSGIRRTCKRWWGRSRQERPRGGALGILVSRPGCSGLCRRPGARPGPALALLFFAGFCGTRSQRKARELACFFMTFQGSFHFPDRPRTTACSVASFSTLGDDSFSTDSFPLNFCGEPW